MLHLPSFKIVFANSDSTFFTIGEDCNPYRPNSRYQLDGATNFQRFDAIDLTNEILRINLHRLCLECAELMRGYRSMYPLKMNSYIQPRPGEKGRWVEPFQLMADKYPASAKTMLAKFRFCVAKCAEGVVSRSTAELLWRFFSFFLQDDKWIIESGCEDFDFKMLESWGAECEWVLDGFSSLARSRFASSREASSLFDLMAGVKHYSSTEKPINRSFYGGISAHGAKEYMEHFDPSNFDRYCSSKGWQNGMPYEWDLAEVMCGCLHLNCIRVCSIFPECGSSFLAASESQRNTLLQFSLRRGHSSDDKSFRSSSLFSFIAAGHELLDKVSKSKTFLLRNGEGCVEEVKSLEMCLESAKRFCKLFYDDGERSSYRDIFESAFSENVNDGVDFSLELFYYCLRWEKHRRLENVNSLPEFVKCLLSSMLYFGAKPKLCKGCGKPFFPASSNHRYCERVIPQTGVRCSDLRERSNRDSGYTGLGNRWQNIIKKQKASHKANEPAAEKYYEDLASYFHDEVGPLYQKSLMVDEELFDEWLKAVDGPSRTEYRQMSPGDFPPYFMIWDRQVVDGRDWADVTVLIEKYPDLTMLFCDLSEKKPFDLSDTYVERSGRFFARGSWLLRSVLRHNLKYPDSPLPVPGLVDSPIYKLLNASAGMSVDSVSKSKASQIDWASRSSDAGVRISLER